jgi:hypothetical protein
MVYLPQNGEDFERRPFVFEFSFPTGYKYADKGTERPSGERRDVMDHCSIKKEDNTTQTSHSSRLGDDTRIGTPIVAVRLELSPHFRLAALRALRSLQPSPKIGQCKQSPTRELSILEATMSGGALFCFSHLHSH